ncbi:MULTISPECIES: hypothetical protein [Salinibaculum]|uniref:hypothetical protein n=1 Tax=Salinibaculum TaxID=2732368 RepID=UPI0030CCC1F9
MGLSRREVLQLGSGLIAIGMAGCTNILSNKRLRIEILNFDTASHKLSLEVISPTGGNNLAPVLEKMYDLPDPNDETATTVSVKEDLPAKKYLIRTYLGDNPSVRENFIFYANQETGPEAELYVEVRRDVNDAEPYIVFR